MNTHMQHFFQFDCGKGCDPERASYEWHMKNCEPYSICGLCGEDVDDCQCEQDKPEIHAEYCFCFN